MTEIVTLAGLARLASCMAGCSKRALKRCKHGTTADTMSGHKNVVSTTRAEEQGRNDVVPASRVDEQKRDEPELTRDQLG